MPSALQRGSGRTKLAWEQEQRSIRFVEQCAALPQKKENSEFLPLVHAQVLQNVLRRVDRSFQNFFRRCRKGQQPGYPRFKGRGWYDSFCYPQWGCGSRFRDGRLILSKIGALRVCTDRPLYGKPKTCTIIRRADGWYACIVCEYEPCSLPATGESVGVDLGLEYFATLSNGEQIANPKFYQRAKKRLAKAQRRLCRRGKGSKRRAKARVLLAKAHLKVRRARLDFCHKVAHDLVVRFDTIAVEKLNIQGLLRNHPLAQTIFDAGWGLFLSVLRGKAESAGRAVVEVNPAGTSQLCSRCAAHVPKKLSVRWHSCPYCGCELHRDVNAAVNIQKRGGGTAFEEPLAVAGA